MGGIKDRVRALVAELRRRRPIADHVFQAVGRYSADQGGRLTSVITLPGFLSFFPLLGLALSIAGYVAHYDHGAQAQITKAINGYFPGFDVQSLVRSITEHRTSTGVISVVGLLVSGLGLITTLRGATRSLFHLPQKAGNFFVAKAKDLVTLLTLGLALILSFGLTAAATSATHVISEHSPLPHGGVTQVLLRAAAIVIAIGGDVLLFGTAFTLLPQSPSPVRDTLDGALFAAIGFEILKSVGAIYLQRTTSNPLYGSFAVAIGLLVWTKLVAQLFVLAAAWAVTGPYQPDTAPSGTAPSGTAVIDAVINAVPAVPAPSSVPAGSPGSAAHPGGDRYAILGRRYGTAVLGATVGTLAVAAVGVARSVLPRRS
jgi:membrane protein